TFPIAVTTWLFRLRPKKSGEYPKSKSRPITPLTVCSMLAPRSTPLDPLDTLVFAPIQGMNSVSARAGAGCDPATANASPAIQMLVAFISQLLSDLGQERGRFAQRRLRVRVERPRLPDVVCEAIERFPSSLRLRSVIEPRMQSLLSARTHARRPTTLQ